MTPRCFPTLSRWQVARPAADSSCQWGGRPSSRDLPLRTSRGSRGESWPLRTTTRQRGPPLSARTPSTPASAGNILAERTVGLERGGAILAALCAEAAQRQMRSCAWAAECGILRTRRGPTPLTTGRVAGWLHGWSSAQGVGDTRARHAQTNLCPSPFTGPGRSVTPSIPNSNSPSTFVEGTSLGTWTGFDSAKPVRTSGTGPPHPHALQNKVASAARVKRGALCVFP